MQGCSTLLVACIDVGARFEQRFGDTDFAQRRCQRQCSAAAADPRIRFDAVAQKSAHNGFAFRADRRGQAMDARARRSGGVRTRLKQAHNQRSMTGTCGANQCRCALSVFAIKRMAQRDQAIDRVKIAERGSGGKIGRAQSAQWQPPRRPVQPVGQLRLRGCEREAKRCFTGRIGDFRVGAGIDKETQQRHGHLTLAVEHHMQRRAPMGIARIGVGAQIKQARHQRYLARSNRQLQRRPLATGPAARIGAPIEKLSCEFAQRNPLIGLTGRARENARQQAGAAHRCATREQLAERAHRGRKLRE